MDYLIWIPFIIVLLIYCYFEKINKFKIASLLKVAISAYVAIIAWYAAFKLDSNIYKFIAGGLTFAVPADYFLQYIKLDIKKYRWGIFFFGAMHVLLLTAFYTLWKIQFQEFIIFVLFLGILLFFQNSEKWNLGKVKGQLSIYTLLVIFMASKAITGYIIDPKSWTFVLGLGGLFFFISDLFLGIWDYHNDKFIFLFLNRVIYFVGQLLIAYSLILLI